MRRLMFSLAVSLLAVACSNDGGEPDRITRIDGPAQVDDDVTPEQSPDE